MLSLEISRRLDRLLAAQAKGLFPVEVFSHYLGELVTADNLEDVLERMPSQLKATVQEGIRLDNQKAADAEYLHPEDSPFQKPSMLTEYYLKIAGLLLGKSRALLSVICLPSFQVEWALQLVGSEKNGYSLALAVAKRQIWGSDSDSQIPIARDEVEFPSELATEVCAVWQKMLQRTRYPQRSMLSGLDGVTYHFSWQGLGAKPMAGQTWSPQADTAPGKLVALSHHLYQYVETGEAERDRHGKRIRKALNWFRSLS